MIREIEDTLREATCLVLGLNPAEDSPDAGKVRLTWLKEGAPFPAKEEDVAFLFVEIADDPISQQRDTAQTESIGPMAQTKTEYLLVVQARWVVYGPNADRNVFLIRDGLFRNDIHTLNSGNNLFLITDPSIPRRSPEHINGNWRERWDFRAKFNHKVIRKTEIPWLEPGPMVLKEG